MENSMNTTAKDKLVNDFKTVVSDADTLVKETASQSGQKLADMRAKTGESVNAAKAKLLEAQTTAIARTKETAKATDEYVHENPWKSVGIAAGVGLVLGVLMSVRK